LTKPPFSFPGFLCQYMVRVRFGIHDLTGARGLESLGRGPVCLYFRHCSFLPNRALSPGCERLAEETTTPVAEFVITTAPLHLQEAGHCLLPSPRSLVKWANNIRPLTVFREKLPTQGKAENRSLGTGTALALSSLTGQGGLPGPVRQCRPEDLFANPERHSWIEGRRKARLRGRESSGGTASSTRSITTPSAHTIHQTARPFLSRRAVPDRPPRHIPSRTILRGL